MSKTTLIEKLTLFFIVVLAAVLAQSAQLLQADDPNLYVIEKDKNKCYNGATAQAADKFYAFAFATKPLTGW